MRCSAVTDVRRTSFWSRMASQKVAGTRTQAGAGIFSMPLMSWQAYKRYFAIFDMFDAYAGKSGGAFSGFLGRWRERQRKKMELLEKKMEETYEKIEFYSQNGTRTPYLCDPERLRLDLGVSRRYLRSLLAAVDPNDIALQGNNLDITSL